MALGKIKADTLEHSTAGSLDTQFVVNGSAKAWAFVNQVTATLHTSLNISSHTDSGVGNSLFAYSSAFTSEFHSTQCSSQPTTSAMERPKLFGSNTTTGIRIQNEQANDGTDRDSTDLCMNDLGDLA